MKRDSIETLLDAIHPAGDILEVGFRAGAELEKFHPKSHTIIEADPEMAKRAKKWAAKHRVEVFEGTWKKVLPRLGIFDAIVFAVAAKPSFVREGEEVIRSVEEQIPQLTQIRYSDADLEAFCEQSAKKAPEAVFRFLLELEQNGQIEEKQREAMVHKFKLKGTAPKTKLVSEAFPCLKECLAHHMRIGSRFACILEDSLLEDKKFFNEIAVDPKFHVREWNGEKAFFVLVEKLA